MTTATPINLVTAATLTDRLADLVTDEQAAEVLPAVDEGVRRAMRLIRDEPCVFGQDFCSYCYTPCNCVEDNCPDCGSTSTDNRGYD